MIWRSGGATAPSAQRTSYCANFEIWRSGRPTAQCQVLLQNIFETNNPLGNDEFNMKLNLVDNLEGISYFL